MTKSWTLTFDAKGKLLLPPDLLKHLQWSSGEPIRVTAQGDTVTFERKRALVARVFGSLTPPPPVRAAQPEPAPQAMPTTVAASQEVIAHGD
jgi:hypothetical protein